jgi:hypothetical protein
MNRIVRRALLAAICGSWLATAHAESDHEGHGHGRGGWRSDHGGFWSVPEFDPAAAGAIAVVVGFGAVIVARRRKP